MKLFSLTVLPLTCSMRTSPPASLDEMRASNHRFALYDAEAKYFAHALIETPDLAAKALQASAEFRKSFIESSNAENPGTLRLLQQDADNDMRALELEAEAAVPGITNRFNELFSKLFPIFARMEQLNQLHEAKRISLEKYFRSLVELTAEFKDIERQLGLP